MKLTSSLSLSLLLLLSFGGQQLYAQSLASISSDYRKKLPKMKRQKNIKKHIDKEVAYKADDFYLLEEEWNRGSIQLASGATLEAEEMRYEMDNRRMLLRLNGEAEATYRPIPLKDIVAFSWEIVTEQGIKQHKKYVNGSQYVADTYPMVGVFEILQEGQAKLMARQVFVKVKAYVDESLDYVQTSVGMIPQVRKVEKMEDLYFNFEGNQLLKVSPYRSQSLDYFGEHRQQVASYVKKNGLSFKKVKDVQLVVGYYNSLLEAESQGE